MAGDNEQIIFLQTQRLYLRQFRLQDAPLLFELDSDPEVMRFITKGQPTPMRQIEEEILPRLLGYYTQTPPRGCWAAHLLANGEFIGWFHLRPDKLQPEEMELGYRLKRRVWGQGLATEGSLALVRSAFTELPYEKVSARTLLGNLASQRVMQKAGLQFECHFVYPLELIPEWSETDRQAIKYSLNRGEYQRRKSEACSIEPSKLVE
jgi:RimJ/RimL family protein N-acetyltransferase